MRRAVHVHSEFIASQVVECSQASDCKGFIEILTLTENFLPVAVARVFNVRAKFAVSLGS